MAFSVSQGHLRQNFGIQVLGAQGLTNQITIAQLTSCVHGSAILWAFVCIFLLLNMNGLFSTYALGHYCLLIHVNDQVFYHHPGICNTHHLLHIGRCLKCIHVGMFYLKSLETLGTTLETIHSLYDPIHKSAFNHYVLVSCMGLNY